MGKAVSKPARARDRPAAAAAAAAHLSPAVSSAAAADAMQPEAVHGETVTAITFLAHSTTHVASAEKNAVRAARPYAGG